MKKSRRMSRRGSMKGEGGDTFPLILRTRESIVNSLHVEIIAMLCVILYRIARPIDMLG